MAIRQLMEVYRFMEFQSREDYEAQTGLACPAFNPQLPTKRWRDHTVTDQFPSYDVVARDQNGGAKKDASGNPYLTIMGLPSFIASAVNIPFSTANAPNNPQIIYPPIDKAKMKPGESLVFYGRLTAVVVWDGVPDSPPVTGGGFTDSDRALLTAVAQRLGVA